MRSGAADGLCELHTLLGHRAAKRPAVPYELTRCDHGSGPVKPRVKSRAPDQNTRRFALDGSLGSKGVRSPDVGRQAS